MFRDDGNDNIQKQDGNRVSHLKKTEDLTGNDGPLGCNGCIKPC